MSVKEKAYPFERPILKSSLPGENGTRIQYFKKPFKILEAANNLSWLSRRTNAAKMAIPSIRTKNLFCPPDLIFYKMPKSFRYSPNVSST